MYIVQQVKTVIIYNKNKAVIDRRLRPQCCHLRSSFNRPKSSPVRPLACNWYYCAQFIAKSKAACALRFSWAATSSNIEDMIADRRTHRQTETDRHAHRNTTFPYRKRSNNFINIPECSRQCSAL